MPCPPNMARARTPPSGESIVAAVERDLAEAVNHHGPKLLAEWCADAGAPLLHMSTDCVFDGAKQSGYVETDLPAPLSAYGRSKAAGETAVAKSAQKHLIVRVGWVHSQFGKSFPRTMLQLASTRDEVTVVNDQFGRPTHALDIASGLLDMLEACHRPDFNAWGVYHLAGHGEVDRAAMAEAIFEDSAAKSGPTAHVRHVSTHAFGATANRPLNARLDSPRAEQVFGLRLPDWRGRVRDTVACILEQGLRD